MLLDYAAERGLSWQVALFPSGEDLLRDLEPGRYAVVFLDILMGGQVVAMENGDTLPVSRRHRTELERAYAARSIARVRRGL